MKAQRCLYEFGPFRLDASERQLMRNGRILPLTPKAFDVLLVLVENSTHAVEKGELMERVWPNTFVEEVNLANNVSLLRKVLGNGDRYIQTVPRRGYRFVAAVTELRDEPDPPAGSPVISTATKENQAHSPRKDGVSGKPKLSDDEELVRAERTRESTVVGKKDISDKFAKSAESFGGFRRFVSRKNGVVIALCAMLAVITALGFFIAALQRPQQPAHLRIRSIAVLPFRPLIANSGDESLETGVAEALITKLSGIPGIVVRPIGSVSRYTQPEQDARAAGLEQRVDAVVDGTIQKDGDRVRVTARFIRVKDGSVLWADKFDQKFTNILSVQDAISERTVGALALKLSSNERELLAKHYTENADAYLLYVKGRHLFNKRNEEGLRKAVMYFDEATRIDPNYALAYSGLADSYNMLYVYTSTVDDPEGFGQKTKAAVMRALELDGTLAEAHASFGKFKENFLADYYGALDEYKIAIQLNPNYALARFWNSRTLAAVGQLDEAIAEAKRTQELDPLTMINNTNMGQLLCYARRHDEAIEELNKAADLDPNHPGPYHFLAEAYAAKGMFEEAMKYHKKFAKLSADHAGMGELAYIYALWGKRNEAEKIIVEMERISRHDFVPPMGPALTHAALGQKDKAFAWLEKAVIDEDSGAYFMKVDPRLDALRSDPRFARLLQRKRLAE